MKFSDMNKRREEFDGKTYEVDLSEKDGVWHASISEGKEKIEVKSRSRERALDMIGEKLAELKTWAAHVADQKTGRKPAFVNTAMKPATRKGVT